MEKFIICGNSIRNVQKAHDSYLAITGRKEVPTIYRQGKSAQLLSKIEKGSDAYFIIKAALAEQGEFAYLFKMQDGKILTRVSLL